MKIEIGKYYKITTSEKVIVYATPEETMNANYHCASIDSCGLRYLKYVSYQDFVSEWVDTHPAEKWAIDAKIMVKHKEHDEEYPRHFAKYENNKVYAWFGGTSSFTQNPYCDVFTSWKFARLATEDDM
jgi:hypothetical protein